MTLTNALPGVLALVAALLALFVYHVTAVKPAIARLDRMLSHHDDLIGGGTGAASTRLADLEASRRQSDETARAAEARLSALEKFAGVDVSRIGFVRYDAFDDTGSDLSYALALLNREGDGVVLTSIYSRTDTRTLRESRSRISSRPSHASDEELRAIELARRFDVVIAMINERYYVKIVPQKGETVHRFSDSAARHIAGVARCLGLLISDRLALRRCKSSARTCRSRRSQQSGTQQSTLERIDQHTTDAAAQATAARAEAEPGNPAAHRRAGVAARRSEDLVACAASRWRRRAANVQRAGGAARRRSDESDRMRTLAMRVLNIRHLRDLARAQMIAAIPSIDPVAGADVVGCFCYRTLSRRRSSIRASTWAPITATPVRASAAGTVVANG